MTKVFVQAASASQEIKAVKLKRFIYADNAATTKLDMDAFEAMKPFLLEEYANASQPYSFARAAKNALNEARQTIASCINAAPEEIFFTSGGTDTLLASFCLRCRIRDNNPKNAIIVVKNFFQPVQG